MSVVVNLQAILDDLDARDLAEALSPKCENCGGTLLYDTLFKHKLCGPCEHALTLDAADAELQAFALTYVAKKFDQEP